MKKLYNFYLDCGRMGVLEGLFISTDKEINESIGKEMHFEEVLGKYSEISEELDENHITIASQDTLFVSAFEHAIGPSFGYNPLDYISE